MRHPYKATVFILATLLLVGACNPSALIAEPETTSPEYWPTDGWRASTPEAQGMDSAQLAGLLKTIDKENYGIDSVVVVRNGYLVLDAYVHPFQPDERHIIYSCTKSVVSALIGIAVDQGHIESADVPLLDLFPDRTAANLDADKKAMTLENVLTMSTGLDCRDSYLYRWQGLRQIERSDDWVQFMLDLPMAKKPGSYFEYCNGASFLLSAIVSETTGQNTLAFAQDHLFGPLGITDVEWLSNPQGITIGWSDLYLTPRDMAKIGYLYLKGGQWDGEQVVPAEWVKASTRKHIAAMLENGYGYQWWVDDSGYYMALGYAGQFIFVVPEKNMVVAFVSDLPERDFYVPQILLANYVIPAARSAEPLAANPEAVAELEAQLTTLAGR